MLFKNKGIFKEPDAPIEMDAVIQNEIIVIGREVIRLTNAKKWDRSLFRIGKMPPF